MTLSLKSNSQDSRQTPPLRRCSMVYQPFVQRTGPRGLNKILMIHRTILILLVLGSMVFASMAMPMILNTEVFTPLRWAIIGIFVILFGWIAMTFWTSLIGFITLIHHPLNTREIIDQEAREISPEVKIAIVMPVYHEDISRIFAGLQTMYESLQRTGQLEHFSFFVLSDSQPEEGKQEEVAWEELCRKVEGFGRIFYRRRKTRIHKKSGNISDFCRRWGANYTYMITLDADSLMSGPLMVDMSRIMEARRDIGILQTAPKGINQKSLGARINQFCSYAYGPLFLSGSYFWQLDDAGFWGHNAIVRLEPFIKFCALPKVSGSLPFGGEILSHDFIESALMRRSGWGVWLAYDLEDSYEELPPNLLEELERDTRWCRGNLQHLRLIFMKGVSWGHRLLFLNGNMFYFSSFLWLMLLILMTAHATTDFFYKPQYFTMPHSLYPHWPIQYRHLSIDLLLMTIVFLFLPKVLSIIWIVYSRKAHLFGGVIKLILSVFLETIFSMILAPIRMLFHSWFVLTSLLGGNFDWKKQIRHLRKVSFLEACKIHWKGSLVALVWGLVAFEVNQTLFWWMSVIVVPLILAVPITMVLSYLELGELFKRGGLFLTPVEIKPPIEVERFNDLYQPS